MNQLAKTHSKNRVLQIRSYMRVIFAQAVDTTENIYMQILQPGVRATLEAIHTELSRKADAPATPEPPTPPGTKTTVGSPTEKDVVKRGGAIPNDRTVQVAAATAKPARGVVLEFASKLPPTRRKEVLLNV